MKIITALTFFSLTLLCISSSHADTFGIGLSTFDIEFVSIGNPGNLADTTGNPNPAGSVAKAYRIGKYEVSEQMIDKANALGGLGITKDSRGPDKPATSVSWNEAARFINWLNTSSGSTEAYKFDLQPGDVGYNANANIQLWDVLDEGYNPSNLFRNSRAKYFLPSVDEWYKAAYYDPTANSGAGGYWDFPTGSNTAPIPVSGGMSGGTAVYNQSVMQGPADITNAGGLSPYGVMGLGGNVFEWEETEFDLVNDNSSSFRDVRGGCWSTSCDAADSVLSSSFRFSGDPTNEVASHVGFRVASIPEPSTALLGALASVGILLKRWS